MEIITFRLISKPLIVISLILFYILNQKESSKKKYYYMLIALSFFLLGDMFLIFEGFTIYFSLGLLCFVFGKLFYAFRFSNQNDFNLIRLLPICSFTFLYMLFILNLVYDNLGDYFFPVLIYLFVAMIVTQFVYLRKSEVDYKSYLLVGIGVFFAILADSIAVLSSFYMKEIFYEKITLMLFYGISQYLIVFGIIIERVVLQNSPFNIDTSIEEEIDLDSKK